MGIQEDFSGFILGKLPSGVESETGIYKGLKFRE